MHVIFSALHTVQRIFILFLSCLHWKLYFANNVKHDLLKRYFLYWAIQKIGSEPYFWKLKRLQKLNIIFTEYFSNFNFCIWAIFAGKKKWKHLEILCLSSPLHFLMIFAKLEKCFGLKGTCCESSKTYFLKWQRTWLSGYKLKICFLL